MLVATGERHEKDEGTKDPKRIWGRRCRHAMIGSVE
jgi:hypothetical protein